MKCPLLKRYFQSETDKWHTEIMDCGKEECAWWNTNNNECCLMSVGKVLNYMTDYIHDIKDKMPTPPTIKR